MSKEIIEFEKNQEKGSVPSVQVGDTVRVSKVIIEGKKKRIQKFEGTVIKLQGSSSRKSVTIRKVIDNVGVEKSFLLHSPLLPEIVTIKRSKVRRAKLYYLRDRIGAKANRLKARD
ncbi:50S ribosomal protein L19 [Candidatus Marinamargulisbacteria bacterium SCGC AAA071-K20]|nr:50S ribosomal protein L19 [Candidatus Marinamargulisbacteria bacterium SCGC AAA071-K20]